MPHVHYQSTPTNEALVAKLEHLRRPVKPLPFFTNRHVETIAAALFRRKLGFTYRRELLPTPDGGVVALDWPWEQVRALEAGMVSDDAPLVILFPGLTGGSGDTYVQYMIQRLWAFGILSVVFNSRGTSDSPVTSPQFYSASFTGDAGLVVDHVSGKFPHATLVGVGWSLGANILVNYLGEQETESKLAAAVSLCNPFDLTISNQHISRGFCKVYDANLAGNLRRIFRKHMGLFQEGSVMVELAAECRSIREFDEAVTHRVFKWQSVDEYYALSGSCHAIPRVAVPLLCVQALDDPIAPAEAIPYDAIQANPHCVLVTTETGGHLGWLCQENGLRGAPWPDFLVAQWVQAVADGLRAGLIAKRASAAQVAAAGE